MLGNKIYGRNQYLIQQEFPVKDHNWWVKNLKELSELQLEAETTGNWTDVDDFMKKTVGASFYIFARSIMHLQTPLTSVFFFYVSHMYI